MPPEAALDPRSAPTPEACRRYFHERGDASLGLVPMLLLDERRADVWAWFWFAARHADDDVESGRASVDDYLRRLRAGGEEPSDLALARFFDAVPADWNLGSLRERLEGSIRALGRELQFREPPPLQEYAAVVRDKAGVPLEILNLLLLPGEDVESVRRFSGLLALSIQIGDDVRDRARDLARGLHTVTREELALARERYPSDPDPFPTAIVPWREAASQWLAILALERAERFEDPDHRGLARREVLLWLREVETGELRDQRHPMRWPAPLDGLLREGLPSAARMAAGRRVVHQDPDLLGDVRRWEARDRPQELQRVRKLVPDLYLEFERHARPE